MVLFAQLALSASTANAALVFAINGQEGSLGSLFTFTNVNPSFTFTVQVRRDDFDSGGDRLESFGFGVRTNAAVAKFTAVNRVAPDGNTNIAGVFEADATPTTLTDAFASARGNYNTRPPVHFAAPGNWVSLATFTITGVNLGNASLTIEELTIGNNDFLLGNASDPPIGQDRTGFTGDGTFIGVAGTSASFTSNITAVPEPSSLLMLAGGLLSAQYVRRRNRKQAQ